MWNCNIALPLRSLPWSTERYRFAIGRLTGELELAEVSKQRKRMKERPKENKKAWDVRRNKWKRPTKDNQVE